MWKYSEQEIINILKVINLNIRKLKRIIKNSPFGSPFHKEELDNFINERKEFKNTLKIMGGNSIWLETEILVFG